MIYLLKWQQETVLQESFSSEIIERGRLVKWGIYSSDSTADKSKDDARTGFVNLMGWGVKKFYFVHCTFTICLLKWQQATVLHESKNNLIFSENFL